jgi:hypothetical protein
VRAFAHSHELTLYKTKSTKTPAGACSILILHFIGFYIFFDCEKIIAILSIANGVLCLQLKLKKGKAAE